MIKGYKGFDKNLKCRDFQYEVGQEYEHNGRVVACESGFHFCEEPLNVFNYYLPAESEYCEVEGDGTIAKESGGDSKVACSKIKIGAKINFLGLASAQIEWVKSKIDNAKPQTLLGYSSVASNSGDGSVASNSGDGSVASNSGYRSVASNSGYKSVASNSGNRSVASNSGYRSVASNSGNSSVASNSGDRSVASNSGYSSVASNSGNSSVASNSGYSSVASNSGNSSVASNSGDRSVASNSGYRSVASNSGYKSVASNSGNRSVAIAWGIDNKAKAVKGSYIALSEWIFDNNKCEYVLKTAKMRKVDGKVIKADTFYTLKDGKFIEVE